MSAYDEALAQWKANGRKGPPPPRPVKPHVPGWDPRHDTEHPAARVQRFVCGATGDLPPESEAELREIERYLSAGGKRVWGSFSNWRLQQSTQAASDE